MTDREVIAYQVPGGPGGPDAPDVIRLLGARFTTGAMQEQVGHVTYYDTFDARLRRGGMVLSRGGIGRNGELSLTSLEGRPIARCDAHEGPGLAGDLPEGPLREAIGPRTRIRRLLPLVEIDKTISGVRVLDEEDKTVVYVRRERSAARDPLARADLRSMPDVIRVVAVKGYRRALARVTTLLEDELHLKRLADDELAVAMGATGRVVGTDPSRITIELDPECPAEAAMRQLYTALLEVVEVNEPGTRERLDTEFLHDFRVTVRRMRSALGQVKGVFPEADRERFSEEFAWLAGTTGPARDADVFLLKLRGYRDQLPERTHNDLAPLEQFLLRRRDAAYRDLVVALDSPRYARLLEQWRAFLLQPAPACESAPFRDRPVREVASKRIWSLAKGVLKKGSAIDDDTPAQALHQLRIRCKKFRYLIDLFGSLYDPDEIARLIRALKKLQDNLGDFNDCEVQQDRLTVTAREMVAEGTTPVETILAMGRLEDRLEIAQLKERRRFSRRFAAFADRENRDRLRRLFGPKRGRRK